jgi:hypothetical protein
MLRLDPCFAACPVELLESLVLEALDHTSTVSCIDTRCNGSRQYSGVFCLPFAAANAAALCHRPQIAPSARIPPFPEFNFRGVP